MRFVDRVQLDKFRRSMLSNCALSGATGAEPEPATSPPNAQIVSSLIGLLGMLAAFLTATSAAAVTFHSDMIAVDELHRDFHYHVPTPVPDAAMAVVFVLHGGAGRAEQFAGYLNFDVFAARRKFLVVYPQGFERHWNDGRPDVSYSTHIGDVDDIAFLRSIVEFLAIRYPIDRSRIYAAGISNGGMMSLRVACEAADTFAAVAAVTASFPIVMADRCNPVRPISVMLINGSSDPVFPYDGGTIGLGRRSLGRVQSTPDTVARWVTLNGCQGLAKAGVLPDIDHDDDSQIVVERYLPCRGGTEVTLYRVEGGGHTWPGRSPYLPRFLIGKTNRDIDATAHILDFFSRHAMPSR